MLQGLPCSEQSTLLGQAEEGGGVNNQGTYMPGDSTQHHKEEEKSMIIQPMQVELGPESTPQVPPRPGPAGAAGHLMFLSIQLHH